MLADAEKLKRYALVKSNPALAVYLAIEEAKNEAKRIAETILERELARIEQTLDKKFESFLESGRGERIVERIIGETDIAGAILKTGLTLKGDKGNSPIAGIDYPIPKDGKTPTKEELKAIILPLIPEPITGGDGEDGKNPNPEDVVPLVLKKLPKPEELKAEQIAAKLNTLEEKVERKVIKGLDKELSAMKQNIRASKGKQAGGGGIAGSNITSDQFMGDGSTKVFTTTKTIRKALVLVCSDSPISYRLTTDYTASGTTLTFTGAVAAPSNGATITFLFTSA